MLSHAKCSDSSQQSFEGLLGNERHYDKLVYHELIRSIAVHACHGLLDDEPVAGSILHVLMDTIVLLSYHVDKL